MNELKCEECGKNFQSIQGKLGHMRMKHKVEQTNNIPVRAVEVIPAVPKTEAIKKLIEELEEEKIKRKIREIKLPFHIEKELEELQNLVNYLFEKVEGSPLTGLKNEYECDNCKKKHFVAVQVMCTRCEETSWWGWYP